ncbi:MAG TPA: M14 family metallopeptidase [Vicinamibacterales bacterium]|nr:M14 family metallopeptidase [Vicinamibacterales bacterium]
MQRRIVFGKSVAAATTLLLAVPGLYGQGQAPERRMYQVGGGARDGASAFPRVNYWQMRPLKEGDVDFKHYHSYEEATALLRMWTARHPNLVRMYSVGKSLEGRDLWQVTITNQRTGADTDKAAFFIEGGRHAGEITGIEATLYFINHVLTNYGKDPAITKLLDTKAIYAKPHNNPDGASLYHYTAQTLRSSVRPTDSDNDGLLDEDPQEDLDGDGFSRQMRKHVGAGKGNAVVDDRDPQGRLMRIVGAGQGEYQMYTEGVDNDGDGAINEDGIGGLDLHRNYPENWRPMTEETGRGYTQGGAGAYPLSEPETKAVFDFLIRHPNVGIVQSLDTSVPMILRGPSTSKSEESVFPEDLEYLRKFDAKGIEITGYPWAGDTYFVYSTRGQTAAPGQELQGTPLFGHGPDFGYLYYGAIWYGNEIWDGGRVKDYNGDGTVDDLERLRWTDETNPGKNDDFQRWTKTQHPTLGEVEVGGWNPKFWSQNPPPVLLEQWARNEAMFNLYLAQQLAQVRVVSAESKRGADGNFEITATVTNEGGIPTALEIAKRVKIVRPDVVSLELSQGQSFVGPPAGGGRGAGFGRGGGGGGRGGAQPQAPRRATEIGWLKPGETKTVSWTVSGTGTATVTIGSTRGGVDRRTVAVR